MTVSIHVNVNGYEFEFMSSSWKFKEACIVIPLSTAEAMDGSSLGEILGELIEEAYFADALGTADEMIQYSKMGSRNSELIPVDIIEDQIDRIDRLRKFAGQDQEIDKALRLIDVSIEAARIAAERKAAKEKVRSELQAGYHKTLVRLGRRDGFRCASCHSSDADLQIDHVIPVSRGGMNDLDNLQLLCRKCNTEKSDKLKSATEINHG
jgi:hypothetical protein